MEFLRESVTDEIVWNVVGDRIIEGHTNFLKELEKMKSVKASELIIDQILSHGKGGATNGIMKMQNGKQYAFSDFYVFSGAKGRKIKTITSYVIQI